MKLLKTNTIYHNVKVKNQFHFSQDSRTACVPISIQALFHLYDALQNRQTLLNDEQWSIIMQRGVRLWQIWKNLKSTRENSSFPTINEILSLSEAKQFCEVFGKKPVEYAGLAKDSKQIDNKEGSLQQLVRALVYTVMQDRKSACAIVILPVNVCISMLCRLDSEAVGGFTIYLFDSHGKTNSQYCEFVQFFETQRAVTHILEQYQIESIDSMSQQERALYAKEEEKLVSLFCYSAMLFVK